MGAPPVSKQDVSPPAVATWRPTLRLTIAVVLSALILITAAALTAISYFSTRRSLLRFSRELIAHNADVVHEQVRGYLDPARSAAALTLAFAHSGLVEVRDPKSVERYFFNFLTVQETVAMLNYGDERGNFVMVKRQRDGSLSTKVITIDSDGSRKVVWRDRDPGGPLEPPREEREDPDDRYDPRTRPWYKGASADRALHWTGVYVFFTDKLPGVTAAVPHIGADGKIEGVLSVDVGLVDLSLFLRDRIRVGKSGQAFLLDDKRQLIAQKQVDALTIGGDGKKRRLRSLGESTSPEVAALARSPRFDAYFRRAFEGPAPEPVTLRYEAAGQAYVATLMPIQVGETRRWLAGVVALEDEFLGPAKEANLRALLTGLGFVVIALGIGVMLARLISRSLRMLVAETARVKQLQIDSQAERSRFREVDDVLQAFEGMKTGLRAFRKYVPGKLVEKLVDGSIDAELGGEERTVTIFFSDIRNFTTISEGLEPLELATVLGEYLSVMTAIIHERSGIVDKYIGDAVMAFWGAPDPVPQHAHKACEAALACLEVVKKLEHTMPNMPELYTRFGIHTAQVVVGNFGSDDRLNYTLIGDGVNLASRLEGTNKAFGTQILISAETQALVGDAFDTRKIGLVAVKGRETPCPTYELLGPAGSVTGPRLEAVKLYEEALTLHLDREWDEAIATLERVLELTPDDMAARRLLERTEDLKESPPKRDWSGVIAIDTK